MSMLRQLAEKPWETAGEAHLLHDARRAEDRVGAVALGMFLAIVTVLFSLLVVAYAARMAPEPWRPTPQPWLLWANSGLLLIGSVAYEAAVATLRHGMPAAARAALLAAGGFTVAFLAGQLAAWRQLDALPTFDVTNPAIAFFYLITGLHALHLLGGLVAWAVTTRLTWRAGDGDRAQRWLRLAATYAHYLFGVWLVLFVLLFARNENLELLMSICGFR